LRAFLICINRLNPRARDIAEGYRLGANGYVVRPVDFERFRDVARRLCDYWLGLNELPQAN